MINAYDKMYLEKAQVSLGRMLDYAVYGMGLKLDEFWDNFLKSQVSRRFESGDVCIIAGKSGIELTLEVTDNSENICDYGFTENRSMEYWAGWALAYYQWYSNMSFGEITEVVPINSVLGMYSPYHEMDIRQFCDRMMQMMEEKTGGSRLRDYRVKAGISQRELSIETGIPIRTIQQYEQRQKDINRANVEYLMLLSKALCCRPENLLEIR